MSVIPLDHRGLYEVDVFIKLKDGIMLALQPVKSMPRRGQWKLTKNGDILCHRRRGEVIVVRESRKSASAIGYQTIQFLEGEDNECQPIARPSR